MFLSEAGGYFWVQGQPCLCMTLFQKQTNKQTDKQPQQVPDRDEAQWQTVHRPSGGKNSHLILSTKVVARHWGKYL